MSRLISLTSRLTSLKRSNILSGKSGSSSEMSFWEHLEVFRWSLLRSLGVLLVLFFVLLAFKGFLFDTVVLGPIGKDFWLYRLLGINFSLDLINIDLTAQFFTHIKVAFLFALIAAFPYLCFEAWHFIAPALYKREKLAVRKAFSLGAGLFYGGVAVGYFIIVPLMLLFFNGYQVSASVVNNFSLKSYISIFCTMILIMGVMFEFPSVIAVLGQLGVVSRKTLRKYRRHAILVILIFAAILTPTGDPVTLTVVSLPLYLLYEFSILLCP